MNEDAEKWLSKYSDPLGPFIDVDTLRDAMRWAYADAAKVAYQYGNPVAATVKQAIEERAK